MGEPLHNYDQTMKALRILHSDQGLAVPPRRVTLSTVGIIPGLKRLAGERLMPNLAISLHATTDKQRTALVPPNRRYPLADLLDACRRFPLKKRSRITFEYVLLNDVNDTPEDARRTGDLAERHQVEGESSSAQSRARYPVRATVRRSCRPLCSGSGGLRCERVCTKEPRSGHPSGVWSAHCRRRGQTIGRTADGLALALTETWSYRTPATVARRSRSTRTWTHSFRGCCRSSRSFR